MARKVKSRKLLSEKEIKFYKTLYNGLFVGITEYGTAVYLEESSSGEDFSITGTGIESHGKDYDTVYEIEKESLIDGYGVDTEEELEEAQENGDVAFLKSDEATIDDFVSDSIDNGDYILADNDLYYFIDEAGQMQDSLKHLKQYAIEPSKIKRLLSIWDKYQLEPLKSVPKTDLEFVNELFNRGQ